MTLFTIYFSYFRKLNSTYLSGDLNINFPTGGESGFLIIASMMIQSILQVFRNLYATVTAIIRSFFDGLQSIQAREEFCYASVCMARFDRGG
jgi:hypothetical protein